MSADEWSQMPEGTASPMGPAPGVGPAGIPPWRLVLAASLALAAMALWVTVAHEEARFARGAVGPEADLLSAAEMEDQLHM